VVPGLLVGAEAGGLFAGDPGDVGSGFFLHELNIARFGPKVKGANRTSKVRVTVPQLWRQ
jgi:hypothetical protein